MMVQTAAYCQRYKSSILPCSSAHVCRVRGCRSMAMGAYRIGTSRRMNNTMPLLAGVLGNRASPTPQAVGRGYQCRHVTVTSASLGDQGVADFGSVEKIKVFENGALSKDIPMSAGVYAVYDGQGTLQYVGISRKVGVSVQAHVESLPELVDTMKVAVIEDGSKEVLTEAWKQWIQSAGARGALCCCCLPIPFAEGPY